MAEAEVRSCSAPHNTNGEERCSEIRPADLQDVDDVPCGRTELNALTQLLLVLKREIPPPPPPLLGFRALVSTQAVHFMYDTESRIENVLFLGGVSYLLFFCSFVHKETPPSFLCLHPSCWPFTAAVVHEDSFVIVFGKQKRHKHG